MLSNPLIKTFMSFTKINAIIKCRTFLKQTFLREISAFRTAAFFNIHLVKCINYTKLFQLNVNEAYAIISSGY